MMMMQNCGSCFAAEQFVGIIGVKIVEVKKKEQEKSYAN